MPEDVLLIEVPDTSLSYDRGAKLPLYARAGIPEVWILNLVGEVIERHTNPSAESYRGLERARRGERSNPSPCPSWLYVSRSCSADLASHLAQTEPQMSYVLVIKPRRLRRGRG
jgi:hypothetical protein